MYNTNSNTEHRPPIVGDALSNHVVDEEIFDIQFGEKSNCVTVRDFPIVMTRFSNTKNTNGILQETTWSGLNNTLSDPTESKDIYSLPLLKFSKLPNNSRRSGTVPENMTAVIGDYDDGQVSIDEAINRLTQAGISAFIYTTRRHRPEAPRWRVIAQLSSPVSCDEYANYLDVVNGALGGILAEESWETTRSYFYGKVAGVEYRFEQVLGLPIDIKMIDGVDWDPIGTNRKASVQRNKKRPIPAIGNDREFERAITLNDITDSTMCELAFALDAIKDRADPRDTWIETFLAMQSLKGSKYENQARSMIEDWSKNYSTKWGEKEDDDAKWDREVARDITYLSIFHWADEQDEKLGIKNTKESWRKKAKQALEVKKSKLLGENVVPYSKFVDEMEPPHYIWHRVLQKGCLYALTAQWGHGKTALMITVAMHIATGKNLGGRAIEKQRVLYLCGENPADVRLRTIAAAARFGIDSDALVGQIFFTRRPFALENPILVQQFVDEAINSGPFGLVVIDTGPAHSSASDENANREMHTLAMAMRDLMAPLGNPATVALMHPAKEAKRDNLQPRGGGAFSGSIDGELCVWQEHGQVEFFHRTKFRGRGFESMRFELEKIEVPGMVDNFDESVVSVLAVESTSNSARALGKPLTGANLVAYKALIAALDDLEASDEIDPNTALEVSNALNCAIPDRVVHIERWRAMAYDMGISDGGAEAKKKAFKRAREKLIAEGSVITWKEMCWVLKK